MLNHGFFGIGGLVGPFIVYVFETNAFAVIGLLFAIMIPAYMKLPNP
jgi:hypothetical protein